MSDSWEDAHFSQGKSTDCLVKDGSRAGAVVQGKSASCIVQDGSWAGAVVSRRIVSYLAGEGCLGLARKRRRLSP